MCYLCSTPQINTWCSDWIQFYGEHRLGYQLKLAQDQYGDSTIYQRGYSCPIKLLSTFLMYFLFYIMTRHIYSDTDNELSALEKWCPKYLYPWLHFLIKCNLHVSESAILEYLHDLCQNISP